MNDQTQVALASFLNLLTSAGSTATGFATEQAPILVQQYLLYGRIHAALSLLLSAALIAGFVFSCVVFRRWIKANGDCVDVPFAYLFFGMYAVVVGAIIITTVCVAINTAILVYGAPNVWLLQEASSLLKVRK